MAPRREVTIPLNESAYRALSCEKRLELVPGATHLFEEPGSLRRAADLAAACFVKHLCGKWIKIALSRATQTFAKNGNSLTIRFEDFSDGEVDMLICATPPRSRASVFCALLLP